ncbi:MAG: hypothetical protein KF873_08160 [Gemmataceae bacterium]|nr:hypothetical protein [Gemmataceae bacterium]
MNPSATLEFARPAKDREWIWLSESLTATLRVEGPAPLVVAAPKDWLAPTAAGAWKVTALGRPKEEKLANGRAVWTQSLRLDPYVPGEGVPLAFVALPVRAGGTAEASLELPARSFTVKTRFENAQASDALPITGYEDPPAPAPSGPTWPGFALVGFGIALAVAVRALRRRSTATTPAPTPAEQLAALDARADSLDDATFANELAILLRNHLEAAYGVPAPRRATPELGDAPPLDRFRPILDRCDEAKFGAAPIDRRGLLAAARELLVEPDQPRQS